MNLNEAFEFYIKTRKKIGEQTLLIYRYNYDKYIANGLGLEDITQIGYLDILRLYSDTYDLTPHHTVPYQLHTILGPVFALAYKAELITKNPADKFIYEYGYTLNKRISLSQKQSSEFLEILQLKKYQCHYPFFLFLMYTGCRVMEAASLRWCDINLESNTISINHSMHVSGKHKGELSKPKTDAAVRTIPISSKLGAVLTELNESTKYMDAFVFHSKNGGLYSSFTANRIIKNIIAFSKTSGEYDELPPFTCHSLRHTFATRLFECSKDFKSIQNIMGHKKIQTTLDIYVDTTNERKIELIKSFDEIAI